MFKQAHLGPVIGGRTWAGVRGYDGPSHLLDGGHLTLPDIGLYSPGSKWVVENIGVEPDVRIHDEPGQLERGHDAPLDTAMHRLMKRLKASPRKLPPPARMQAFPPPQAYPECADTISAATCG